MLDLFISYINFLILAVGYIVKRFTFFPPNPPDYRSVPTDNEDEEEIQFLIKRKKKDAQYIGIDFHRLDYRYLKVISKDNNVLPLLLFYPPSPFQICIIYSHGNSGDLGSCLLEYYDIALNTNCFVVSFEYPGYGECKNQPKRESQFFRNAKMAYYFVKKYLGFKSSQIILYGFSLGTGIMFDLACKKEYRAAGLILQSPFLSIMRTLYDIKKTRYFDLFNNCDKAKNLCLKTLFIHGDRDTMVPYVHGKILSTLIPKKYLYSFLTVPDAGHNNIFKIDKDNIYKTIREFIQDSTGMTLFFPLIKGNGKKKDKKHSSDDNNSNKSKEKEKENNIKKDYNNKDNNDIEKDNTNNEKLNKSGYIISPSINIMINNTLNNNDSNILLNNINTINNSELKNIYPTYYINNANQNLLNNNYSSLSQVNSKIYTKKGNGLYNFENRNINDSKKKMAVKDNKGLNINNIADNLDGNENADNTNNNYLTSSTLNNLNNYQ